ncbi:protein-tyrosine phosphatase [Syncephalis plumigaleata]|nr:protein-tyrosine phosphatase [Syncephalis plumigaleata]
MSTTNTTSTSTITQLYTPPEAFGVVAPGIYRSDTMQVEHLPFLKTLGLRVIVMLSPEKLSRAAAHFIEEDNIRLEHIGLRAWKPDNAWRPVSDELLKEGMELLLDAHNHPILIMCTTGIHETGMLVGCLRRLQHWSFTSILTEYRAYCGSKARYMNEQFIERFDLDLITLPENLPSWFMHQGQMLVITVISY